MTEDISIMRTITIVGTLAVSLAFGVTPALAADKATCPSHLEQSYTTAYNKVAHRFGKRAPGRNIRQYGVLFRKVVFDATCGELRRSRGQLHSLLAVPRYYPWLVRAATAPARPPGGVATSNVRGNLPYCTWGPESGGNYRAVNGSNPDRPAGKYQMITGTWLANGGGKYAPTADAATPAQQDEIAAGLYAREGGGPWVNC